MKRRLHFKPDPHLPDPPGYALFFCLGLVLGVAGSVLVLCG